MATTIPVRESSGNGGNGNAVDAGEVEGDDDAG